MLLNKVVLLFEYRVKKKEKKKVSTRVNRIHFCEARFLSSSGVCSIPHHIDKPCQSPFSLLRYGFRNVACYIYIYI